MTTITTLLSRLSNWVKQFFSSNEDGDEFLSNVNDTLTRMETITDNNKYLVPIKKGWGVFGFTYYAAHKPIKVDNDRAITTEELAVVLGDKFRAPITLIGLRKEMLGKVRGLDNGDFNQAKTFDYYEREATKNQVAHVISELHNPVSVFNTWLRVQVRAHMITKLDGMRLETKIIPDNITQFFNRGETCPVGEFIDRYFAAYRQYNELMGVTSYSNVEIFARQLIFEYSMFNMGISDRQKIDDIFPPYTLMYTTLLTEKHTKNSKTNVVSANQL